MHFLSKMVILYASIAGIVVLNTINSTAVRDPTSVFFNPQRGYQPRYSQFRRKQAAAFISAHNNTERLGRPKTSNTEKKLCVGIPSLGRRGAQYVHETIGSLLQGLAADERDEIFLMVFIPHTDPTNHPFYSETWLHELTDRVLTYDIEDSDKEDVRMMEDEGGVFVTKGLYDYSYLLSRCAEQHTPYIAIFEDDVIAMDGWFHRTIFAIHQAEQQTALRYTKNFLYLRLFYTERFMGWNSEDWEAYLFWSLVAAGIFTAVLLSLRKTRLASKLCYSLGSRCVIFFLYSNLVAAILFFFALGRMTVLPVPAGVREMARFGCCSQALVFPRSKASELVSYFKHRCTGFMDVLTEEFAEQQGELRFAMTPSVVQHVGRESSKRTHQGRPIIKEGIWNFQFERYDWEELRREHEANTRNR
jgi:hypothetical protein